MSDDILEPWKKLSVGGKWIVASLVIAAFVGGALTWKVADRQEQLHQAWSQESLYTRGPEPKVFDNDALVELYGVYFASNFIGWALVLGVGILLFKAMNKSESPKPNA